MAARADIGAACIDLLFVAKLEEDSTTKTLRNTQGPSFTFFLSF